MPIILISTGIQGLAFMNDSQTIAYSYSNRQFKLCDRFKLATQLNGQRQDTEWQGEKNITDVYSREMLVDIDKHVNV